MSVKVSISAYFPRRRPKINGFPRNDVGALNSRRSWIIDQLVALVRNGSILKDDLWLQTVLEWLIVNGLFVVRKPSKQKLHRGVSFFWRFLHTAHQSSD